jgi:hypothetical protein
MALPYPKAEDGTGHQEQRQTKSVSEWTRIEGRFDRLLAYANTDDREGARENRNAHQHDQTQKILSFAPNHSTGAVEWLNGRSGAERRLYSCR